MLTQAIQDFDKFAAVHPILATCIFCYAVFKIVAAKT